MASSSSSSTFRATKLLRLNAVGRHYHYPLAFFSSKRAIQFKGLPKGMMVNGWLQEVLRFLEQLTISMGENVEFYVDHYCEGRDGYTVTVNWHLDWKKKQVPCTRGCSYYELSRDRERFVIKKIQVIIESPIKPGGSALAFFKIITSLFDYFPGAAERFLKSPRLIFQLLLKLYHMVLEPIAKPILAWYVKLWSFVLNILSFTLKILYYIAKIINK